MEGSWNRAGGGGRQWRRGRDVRKTKDKRQKTKGKGLGGGRLSFVCCLLSFALLAFPGCAAPDETATTEAPAPPVAVHVVAARPGPIANVLIASGETAALTSVRLSSPVAGRVTAVAVQPGDRLAAGAVAARVLPQENEAALHGFGILADAGALRPSEKPAAERLARDLAARDIPLRAPFDGIVADRLRNPGEQVAPSDVLVELFDPRSLIVVAQVPATRSGDVHPGQPVSVHLAGATLAGRVATLAAAVSPQSLTVPVRITLSTTPRPPLLHAAAECHITVAEEPDALLVPRAALLDDDGQGGATVMVAADGAAHLRPIRTGLRDAEQVEVRDGLSAGELVLVAGQYGLPDGAAVTVQTAGGE